MKAAAAGVALILFGTSVVFAQDRPACRVLCGPEFHVEPTLTFGKLWQRPRIVLEDGTTTREPRETDFEVILSFGLPTRQSWLEFTIETIFVPFERESTPELEFETNLIWLPSDRTGGWVSSHFDIVDKFSAAERPGDRRAYTHKLNFELDTSVAIFNSLGDRHWMKGLQVEGSLDYVATGLPRRGEIVDGIRFADKASPWSFSLVFVLPVAP
jgi:hypothetical protein